MNAYITEFAYLRLSTTTIVDFLFSSATLAKKYGILKYKGQIIIFDYW